MAHTPFTKANAKTIADELVAACQAVAAKHGFTLHCDRVVMEPDGSGGSVRLALAAITEQGVLGKETSVFKQLASAYGMTATDLFREITLDGRRYRITGMMNRVKKPVMLTDVAANTSHCAEAAVVKAALDRDNALVAK